MTTLKRCTCSACLLRQGRVHSQGFLYRVVSGCALFGSDHRTLKSARKAAARMGTWCGRPLEVERVRLYRSGCNYERVRDGKWVDWWEAQFGVHAPEEVLS